MSEDRVPPALGVRVWRRVRFWEQEYSLSALLVMLVVTLFIVTPLARSAVAGSEIMLSFVAVLSVTGVAALSGRALPALAVAALALVGIGIDWFAHLRHEQLLTLLDFLMRLGFVLLLGVIVTIQVFRPGSVTHHRVQGAICVYLLAGLAFAYGFDILLLLDPAALHLPERVNGTPARLGLLRYFSFVNLTTLGYGDILPLSPAARSMATAEALFGQLYPAVMIARLISLELLGRRARNPSG